MCEATPIMRWRRRWFTLKQGEIPEQFCLEYYTDRNCRKLKGIIDLDQCEQVDCGLRLENRKQKFQFMFDIKTPKRTYYLAADSSDDMRDWVNCICQVCHLHDTKHSMDDHDRSINSYSMPASSNTPSAVNFRNKELNGSQQFVIPYTTTLHCDNVYQNNDTTYVNAKHNSSELLNHLGSDSSHSKHNETLKFASTNLKTGNFDTKTYLNTPLLPNLNEKNQDRENALRKFPENLTLQSSPLLEGYSLGIQPSPSLSNSSGPYIPISECFSGTPKHFEDPSTPLNNLDPKFYDTPRSHNNIGLNLTNDQSYSPKITNCSNGPITETKNYTTLNSRSDSDSESVFTDDDEWAYPMPLRENVDRTARPSDSSIENESFILTYSQRFSKLPDDIIEKTSNMEFNVDYEGRNQPYQTIKLYKNKINLSLDIKQNHKLSQIPQLSDTENTSPAIGPQDASSILEESYDIPRSHQLPYHNLDEMFKEQMWCQKIKDSSQSVMSLGGASACSKAEIEATLHKHFYTNAAPNKLEGNVFRYDFIEQIDLPPVNRKLKPKSNIAGKLIEEIGDRTLKNAVIEDNSPLRPPSVDRNLKPNVYKLVNSSLLENVSRSSVNISSSIAVPAESDKYTLETQTLPRSSCTPSDKSKTQMSVGPTDISILHQRSASMNQCSVKTKPLPTYIDEPRLQYFDLDVANPPTVNRQSINITNLTKQETNKLDSLAQNYLTSVVYNSVDFVKTEAFKRIREERKKESESVNSEVKISK